MQHSTPSPILFTAQGYANLQTQLDELTVKREQVVIRLATAREMGDLSENGAYKAARAELGDTDRNIRRLQHLLQFGKPVAPKHDGTVGFGNAVTLEKPDGKSVTYTIVGTYEADPLKGTISQQSPMGGGLIGKRVHETVSVNGNTFTIIKIA